MTAFTLLCLPLEAGRLLAGLQGAGIELSRMAGRVGVPDRAVFCLHGDRHRVAALDTQRAGVGLALRGGLHRLLARQLFSRHSGWTSALRVLVGLVMFMVAQSLMVGAGVFVLFLLFNRG